MPASWIDLHAHLDRLKNADLAAVLDEAGSANVATVLSTAVDLASAATVVDQCRAFSALYGAVGISPFDVSGLKDGWELRLTALSQNPRIIAIAEIGLDDSNPKYPALASQLPVFEKQLAIAGELDLPVIVHSRGAESRVADICNSMGITKAVFHCYTGDAGTLKKLLDYGYYVSFSGIVTFSAAVGDLVPIAPLERIFIETDTPYLAPAPHRGKPNRPAWVSLAGEKVAVCKGVAEEVLREAIAGNFERLFKVKANGEKPGAEAG